MTLTQQLSELNLVIFGTRHPLSYVALQPAPQIWDISATHTGKSYHRFLESSMSLDVREL